MADIGRQDVADEWWTDRNEVVAFARALVESDQLGDPHRVIDYVSEPYRWTVAYRIWLEVGRPSRPGHPRFAELLKRFASAESPLRARAV